MSAGKEKWRRAEVARRIELALGDKVICDHCGATLATYSAKCSADLSVACGGFRAIEAVRDPIVREIYHIAKPDQRP